MTRPPRGSIQDRRLLDLFKKMEIKKTPVSRNDRVLLVDGLNTYLRCFSVTPTLNDNGDHIGGLQGFLMALGATIKLHNPSRVVLIFDGKNGSKARRKIYEGYKGTRDVKTRLNRFADFESPEDEKRSREYQLSRVGHYVKCLPVDIVTLDDIEADDVISYCAREYFDKEVIIYSTDKDFLQLVDERISVYRPVTKKLYNYKNFKEQFGIAPENYHIKKIFEGDASDNVPGIKGIGPSTLIKLFPEVIESSHISLTELKELVRAGCNVEDKRRAERYRIIESKFDELVRNNSLMNLHLETVPPRLQMKVRDILDSGTTSPNLDKLQKLAGEDLITISKHSSLAMWYTTIFARLLLYKEEE